MYSNFQLKTKTITNIQCILYNYIYNRIRNEAITIFSKTFSILYICVLKKKRKIVCFDKLIKKKTMWYVYRKSVNFKDKWQKNYDAQKNFHVRSSFKLGSKIKKVV